MATLEFVRPMTAQHSPASLTSLSITGLGDQVPEPRPRAPSTDAAPYAVNRDSISHRGSVSLPPLPLRPLTAQSITANREIPRHPSNEDRRTNALIIQTTSANTITSSGSLPVMPMLKITQPSSLVGPLCLSPTSSAAAAAMGFNYNTVVNGIIEPHTPDGIDNDLATVREAPTAHPFPKLHIKDDSNGPATPVSTERERERENHKDSEVTIANPVITRAPTGIRLAPAVASGPTSPSSVSALHSAHVANAPQYRERKSTGFASRASGKLKGMSENHRTHSSSVKEPPLANHPTVRIKTLNKSDPSQPALDNNFGLDLDGAGGFLEEGKEDSGQHDEEIQGDAHGKSGKSALFSSFSAHLHLFSYVLLLAGLRQNTSAYYRNWLRMVTYGCTLMCAANIGFHTRSYRNPLFDVSLTLLHILVCVSYEWWLRYCRSKEWRTMMSIVTKVSSAHFARHIRILGWFGVIMVAGATTVITIGWEIPIFSQMRSDLESGRSSEDGAKFAFLVIHGLFMIIIIAPWAAVCMCSVCLFKLVVLAHQSDIEYHFKFMKQTLQSSMEQTTTENNNQKLEWEREARAMMLLGANSGPTSPHTTKRDTEDQGNGFSSPGAATHRKLTSSSQIQMGATHTSPVVNKEEFSPHHHREHAHHRPTKRDLIAECFRPIVKHHQACRARLRVTCAYFDWLYASYMFTSALLLFSAAMDFNRYAVGKPFPDDQFDDSVATTLFPHVVQDSFYLGLGLLGWYACFYVTADLTQSFDRFVRRINDLVMAFPQTAYSSSAMTVHPASLAGLTAYYKNSQTAYTLFGTPVTFSLFACCSLIIILVLFFNLWLVNA